MSLNYAIQPYQQVISRIDNAYGLVCELAPSIYPYTISQINISGPKGKVSIYIGVITVNGLVDSTLIGDSNTAGYSTPLKVPPGSYVYVVWEDIFTGSAKVAFYCEGGY